MQKDDKPATPPHPKGPMNLKADGTPDRRFKDNRAPGAGARGRGDAGAGGEGGHVQQQLQHLPNAAFGGACDDGAGARGRGDAGAGGRQACSKNDLKNDLVLYDPNLWAIPGMCYQSGRDREVQSKPWDLESGAWYVDKDACFPPVFAEEGRATRYGNVYNPGTEVCPVKAIPCWDDEGNSVRWDGGTYTLEEWRQKLTGWHNAFPNIIKDGSTPWETASFRSSQTSKVEIIKQCFDKCKRPTWPSTLTKASREFLQRFRVDMWGNMICLPTTAGGRADNESLCFFDVDHTFPWSRGGRSVLKNFEALQCCANRWVKSDRLVQTLDPREMLCGISAAQLLALVQWVEGGGEGDGGRKDKKALYRIIEGWLTVSPGNGKTFHEFQKDVLKIRKNRPPPGDAGPAQGSSDSSVLREYFVKRHLAWMEQACISGGEQPPAPRPQPSVVAESPRSHQGCQAQRTLKVRVRSGRLEVWGDSTYAVKEELKKLKFFWDGDDGRKCWWRKVDDDQEEVQREVQQLAASRAFAYLLAA